MIKFIKNKKGFSLSSWIEVALFVSLFMTLVGMLIVNMNVTYQQNYDPTFGTPDYFSGVQTDLENYQSTLDQNIKQGQASSTGLGLSLTTTWGILTAGTKIMWTFLTGGFIESMTGLIRLPLIVGRILRILFVLSIGLIIIKLLLKIKP